MRIGCSQSNAVVLSQGNATSLPRASSPFGRSGAPHWERARLPPSVKVWFEALGCRARGEARIGNEVAQAYTLAGLGEAGDIVKSEALTDFNSDRQHPSCASGAGRL
jgi:hypothetical protein